MATAAAITDGAHRLAAAAAFGRPVQAVAVGGGAGRYDYEFFRARGLATVYSDAMATDWLRLRPGLGRVFLLWPAATARAGGLAAALAALSARGQIVYARAVPLPQPPQGAPATDGAELLLRTIYAGEDWLAGGGAAKAARCFSTGPTGDPASASVHVVVFATAVPAAAAQSAGGGTAPSRRGWAAAVNNASRQAKLAVRALPVLVGLGHDAVPPPAARPPPTAAPRLPSQQQWRRGGRCTLPTARQRAWRWPSCC